MAITTDGSLWKIGGEDEIWVTEEVSDSEDSDGPVSARKIRKLVKTFKPENTFLMETFSLKAKKVAEFDSQE
jgi:hypothetical protein